MLTSIQSVPSSSYVELMPEPIEASLSVDLVYQYSQADRVADARDLLNYGFSPCVVAVLTGWPRSMLCRLGSRSGMRPKGGRSRTGLIDVMRVPLLHACASVFVQAVEHQLSFWNERSLSSRSFLRSVQYVQLSLPDYFDQLPMSSYYSLAQQVDAGTVKTKTCNACRSHYAHISRASCLTLDVELGCPLCRLLNLMLPSPTKTRKRRSPQVVSFADLRLHEPIQRYLRRQVEPGVIRSILNLGYVDSRRA